MRRALALAVFGLVCPRLLLASAITLHGRVVDSTGRPLEAARVSVEGASGSASTAADGTFTLAVDPAPAQVRLLVEHAGFATGSIELPAEQVGAAVRIALTPLARLDESITVTATRLDIPLRENPAATSVVGSETLRELPRGVAAEEALAAVPGVKVDNQADGERVHVSIRGQGILTERGVRGIQVLLDGVPLNDPSGFVPDLFDVDWVAAARIEVLRGPVAFLYGGGSSAGIIAVTTTDAAGARWSGRLWTTAGSNGFRKGYAEGGGTHGDLSYWLTVSRGQGDGYREHTAFWANKLSGKGSWRATPRLHLNAVLIGTGFWNENAEGLNLTWLAEDRRMANPDALTYNEYQKTIRQTGAITGSYDIGSNQTLAFAAYFRHTTFTESVPSSVQHRSFRAPGLSLQYTQHGRLGGRHNTWSAGSDVDLQTIDEYRRANLGLAVEGDANLTDQTANQRRYGFFVQDRVELRPELALLAGLRYDRISNQLDDRMRTGGLDLSGSARFQKLTGRLALNWRVSPRLDLFASWGRGFLPPATEELYANPDALGGFNRGLEPATSMGEELGARVSIGEGLRLDASVFHLDTRQDFERYRIADRPLETFYRNAGDSRRYGLETQLRWTPHPSLAVRAAYTFNHFTYLSYESLVYAGDLSGHWLPNSPKHQAYLEAEYRWKGLALSVNDLTLSRAFVDATNLPSIDGYSLLGARVAYRLKRGKREAEIFASGRNLTGTEYIAFTEPDPDGNSYQPGPKAELFGGIQLRF